MKRSQVVFGFLFVALGALLLAEQAGQVDAWSVIGQWWPAVVVVAGIAPLVTRPRNVVGGTLLLVVGGVLLLWTLGLVSTVAIVWPLLLIVIGIWLLSGRSRRAVDSIAGIDDLSAVFDDRRVAMDPGPFTGGEVTTVFGDLELDLRATTLPPEGATLQATTVFGDLDLIVPATWEVAVSGPELFGDVDLHRAWDPGPGAPVLRVHVTVVFGDVDVQAVGPAPAHETRATSAPTTL